MKFIAENNKCKFFDNWLTGTYKGFRILLAEDKKTKKQVYVVIKNNEYIAESQRIEDIYCKIDILSLVKE